MKILITGVLGLYGTNLANLLLEKPEVTKVIGIDDYSRKHLVENPLDLITPSKKFVFIRGRYQDMVAKELDNLNPDVIVHLAAFVSIDESMKKPLEYFIKNELGNFYFSQTLLKLKNRPFIIFASSPEVYGNPKYTPMDEEHPIYPRSVYAVTKLAGEKHLNSLKEWYDYPVIVIRNFNTYGANQNLWGYSAVIPSFINSCLKNSPFTIHNDGKQTRDFLYIKDAVQAYWEVIKKRRSIKGEVFNIGTGKQTSIILLAEAIKSITGSSSEIIYQEGRPGDLSALSANITKIKNLVGWSPNYSLEEGLSETINWYRGLVK